MAERYDQLEWVGGGGYADVYKTRDTWTHMIVAKKVLRVKSPDNVRRFKRERDRLAAYRMNLNVVNLLDDDLDATYPYLILEYSELGSLQQYVKNRRDWKQVVRWMRDISKGLAPIHAGGHWHRDIKPSNILLFKDTAGNIVAKITDFGLAPKTEDSSGPITNSPHGTKGYIDPVATLTGNYTAHSDIYSLGKTLQELLTGNKDSNNYSIDVPVKLRFLIGRMMNWNRNLRPTAEDIYKEAVDLLQPKPVPAPVQPKRSGLSDLITGLGLFLGFAALATANSYDSEVGRYRGRDGKFKAGLWG
jgi:serine/threonine protein kinase